MKRNRNLKPRGINILTCGLSAFEAAASSLMVCAFTLIISGCSSAVQYTLGPDYNERIPNIIAVLPVTGEAEDRDARYLFRTLAQEKLIQMGYSPILLETIDDKLLRIGVGRDSFRAKSPKELSSAFGTDSVLYISITEWDTTVFLTYVSIKIGVEFELYDGATGERLWRAEFDTGDSDMGLERELLELGVIKAYEPAIQRVIDAVFSTIPENKVSARGKPERAYYDWLP